MCSCNCNRLMCIHVLGYSAVHITVKEKGCFNQALVTIVASLRSVPSRS